MKLANGTMICNICKQTVRVRKNTPMGSFPVQHNRPGVKDMCHGFYERSPND